MNNYKDFFNLLFKNKMIQPIWEYVLDLINEEIKDKENKEYYLNIFTIYFSLVDEGNVTISLNKEILLKKWNKKIMDTKIRYEDNEDFNIDDIELIKNISTNSFSYLNEINSDNLKEIVGINKIYEIEDNYLYIQKYNEARKNIISSLDIFNSTFNDDIEFNYKDYVNPNFSLTKGQEDIIKEGLKRNLIVSGGPGTGKTTSILFLLIGLLLNGYEDYKIYLIAPSGKASARMKESIINSLSCLKDDFKINCSSIYNLIANLEESTIHRFLSTDFSNNTFIYNKNHQINEKSIVLVDESSMIDIMIFSSLLSSLPSNARLFMMGDKDQLPSVECGSVYKELLSLPLLKNNIVYLTESKRFEKGTDIYELAQKVNNGEKLDDISWNNYKDFKIEKDNNNKPIFYYLDNELNVKDKEIIDYISSLWAKEYYSSLQEESTSLDINDKEYLDNLFKKSEISKILTAQNEGVRGVSYINKFIKNLIIDKSKFTSDTNCYNGQIMMINKNNKELDLYNGDSGILVSFKDDKTLYFMVKKSTKKINKEGYNKGNIFKMHGYTFYPKRVISNEEINLAYAITIHKSQGSDYKNILVILPSKKGHPLLNRQILYTAITRTKGNTYLLSNLDRLNEAKDNLITRDTNIKI